MLGHSMVENNLPNLGCPGLPADRVWVGPLAVFPQSRLQEMP